MASFLSMDPDFKRRVLDSFKTILEERCATAEHELAELDEAAANETKSSAGDKYETAREMFAQARDLQRRIRDEAEAGLAWIARQDPSVAHAVCGPGALVETSQGWFLLAPLPLSVQVDGASIQGVSTQSPLGLALKGAHPDDRPLFRERPMEIRRVL